MFTVEAGPDEKGDGKFQAQETKGAALDTAWGLRKQGFQNVTITDQTGRVYEPADFAEFFGDGT